MIHYKDYMESYYWRPDHKKILSFGDLNQWSIYLSIDTMLFPFITQPLQLLNSEFVPEKRNVIKTWTDQKEPTSRGIIKFTFTSTNI